MYFYIQACVAQFLAAWTWNDFLSWLYGSVLVMDAFWFMYVKAWISQLQQPSKP